ncbi:MAG: MMPL family transporter [Bdellovibrionaceae bacterium]|nr:MMPL family transporter [Pseudobdellovibrionaceae bacterium]
MPRSLRLIQFYFKWILNKSLRQPRAVVALSLVFFILFGYLAQNLRQIVSIVDQLDPQMRSTQELKRVKDLFGSESSLGFVVEPEGPFFKLADLCLLQNQVNDIVFNHHSIEGVMSPYKIRQAVETSDKLMYVRILPSPCGAPEMQSNPLAPLKNSPWEKIVTDSEARDFAVSIRMKELETLGKFGTFDPQAVDDLIGSIKEKIPFKIWFMGTSAQQLFTMKGLAQSQILNFLVVLIIWCGFRLLFGTWRSGAIFLFTLFFSATAVFGLMGLLGYGMDPLSSCLFLMIAVASIEDFIFISYYQMKENGSFKKTFRQMITASFFTSLTTMMGFGSLVVSDLESIRRFGAMAAIGSFVEWGCVFLVVPSFMGVFPSWQRWVRKEKAWFYKISNQAVKRSPPRWLVHISLLVFVVAGFSVGNLRLSQTPTEVFPTDHPFQRGMEYIKKTRGWVADASLVFEPNFPELKKSEILSIIATNPLVTKIESYDGIENFVSKNIQNSTLTKETVSFELSQTSFSKRFNADSGEKRVILYLQTTNTEELNNFREKVSKLCPQKECWLAGEYIGFADFSKSLIRTLFNSLFLSLFLVALVVLYLTKALKRENFVAVMLSALWGPAWMLVAIYAFDLSVNFVTCIVASTLIGLTGDNAIQYMFGGVRLLEGIERRGIGSVQCALIMALCCLSFAFSYFEPPRTMGILLAAGFMMSLIGDVWVLKGLIKQK